MLLKLLAVIASVLFLGRTKAFVEAISAEETKVILDRLDALEKKNANLEIENAALNTQLRNLEQNVLRPRTCGELRSSNPLLSSGFYFIDPDGIGIGDDAFLAYCDMITGSTMVGHNSEARTNVSQCSEPGCYSRDMIYNATIRQIIALIELSQECSQSITYHCNFAPLEVNGESYAWWTDRNGQPHYYWDGANNDNHTCQCGLSNSCFDPEFQCNCDAFVPSDLDDAGDLTDSSVLPVMRLNFGHTSSSFSHASYTLGRLECKGRSVVPQRPASCADLWKQGQISSGYYHFKEADQFKMFFCDMTKLPSEAGFENEVGFTDVRTSNVAFYATRNSSFVAEMANAVITYHEAYLNEGNALDLPSGVFIAPVSGIYYISFVANILLGNTPQTYNFVHLWINSNVRQAIAYHSVPGSQVSCGFSTLLELKMGDRLTVHLAHYPNASLYDNSAYPYTQFVRFLVRQTLS